MFWSRKALMECICLEKLQKCIKVTLPEFFMCKAPSCCGLPVTCEKCHVLFSFSVGYKFGKYVRKLKLTAKTILFAWNTYENHFDLCQKLIRSLHFHHQSVNQLFSGNASMSSLGSHMCYLSTLQV